MTFLRCIGLAAALFAPSITAQGASFDGIVTHVTDGDSLWVRPASGEAPRQVRLQGIDAPEICQVFGVPSRNALAAHVLHRHVTVRTRARDTYQREVARVTVGGRDVGEFMVSGGFAWSYRFRHYPGPYGAQEARARNARLGLWAGGAAMEPREFRKQHGSCK